MGDSTFPKNHIKLTATYGLPVLWAAGLFVFLNVTSPLQNGPLSVLGAFVLIYLLITSTLYALTHAALGLACFLGWKQQIPLKTVYYLVSVIGLGPVFILALNTLNQLEVKEVILVTALLIIGCFYVLRRTRKEAI